MSQKPAPTFLDEKEIETWPLQLDAELEQKQETWLLWLKSFLSRVYPEVKLSWEARCFTDLQFLNKSTKQPALLQESVFISAKPVDEDGALTATTRVLLCPKQWSMAESKWGGILTAVQVLLLNVRRKLYRLKSEETLVTAHLEPAWGSVVGAFENELGFQHRPARYVVDVRFLPKLQYSLWPQELLGFLAAWQGCEKVIRDKILTNPQEREELGETSDAVLRQMKQWCRNEASSMHVKPPTDKKTPILRSIQAKKHWAGNEKLLRKFEGILGKINKLLCTAVNESNERREAVIAALSGFSSEDDGKSWLTKEYPEGIPGALYGATHTHILDEKLVCNAKQMLRKKMPAGQEQGIDWLLAEYDNLCAEARICPKCGKSIRERQV